MNNKNKVKKYIMITIKDIVIFPKMIVPIFIERKSSLCALKKMSKSNKLFIVMQKDKKSNKDKKKDLCKIGTIVKVLQIIKIKENCIKILIEGVEKGKIINIIKYNLYNKVEIEICKENYKISKEIKVLKNTLNNILKIYIRDMKKDSYELISSIENMKDLVMYCGIICSQINCNVKKKQKILERDKMKDKLEKLIIYVNEEIELKRVENYIKEKVKKQIEKNQKEYYLQEQLKAIYKELGENNSRGDYIIFKEKLKKISLSKKIRAKINNELEKLKTTNYISTEGTIIKNYLDCIIGLPWKIMSLENNNIVNAKTILNSKHYGLKKAKERIIEYLAIKIKSEKTEGNIICLVGPPGVGKTSLAESIAMATYRKFTKITLGGIRDEAEIRGHRKTYIGAMPGKIIQAFKQAKTCNPLVLLDEIDKINNDYKGDPSAALLEVLDKSQNKNFNDHYLEIDYDISRAMFITTANDVNRIPKPLLDRLEVIKLSGYTNEEKLEITKKYLIPKIRKNYNLKKEEINIKTEIVKEIIQHHTKELGVRDLCRKIEKIFRQFIKETLLNQNKKILIKQDIIKEIIGPPQYNEKMQQKNKVGIINGIAYTETGGENIKIEIITYEGKGSIKITGKLGLIMKESIQTSYSYINYNLEKYKIDEKNLKKKDIHIHIPEGAIPKDGPSAGAGISSAMISVLKRKYVKQNIAITGEMTLDGSIIAIGGVREKLIASNKNNITSVMIPKKNIEDIYFLPIKVKTDISIILIKSFEEIKEHILFKYNDK